MVARKTNRIIESVAYALQNSPSSCAAAINCRKKCLEWLVIVNTEKDRILTVRSERSPGARREGETCKNLIEGRESCLEWSEDILVTTEAPHVYLHIT